MGPPHGFTKSSIEKLGIRLRKADSPSDADLGQLEAIRESHVDPTVRVYNRLRDLATGHVVSWRAKSTVSILRKLRLLKTNLSRMQDIGGCRIVGDLDRVGQDRLVNRIANEYPEGRVDDRRASPSAGYRAVHIVVLEEGCSIEIQVRTELQHLWAELSEKISDMLGPELRYDDPTSETPIKDPALRVIKETLLALSDNLEELESRRVTLMRLDQDEANKSTRGPETSDEHAEREVTAETRAGLVERLDSDQEELRTRLKALLDKVEAIGRGVEPS